MVRLVFAEDNYLVREGTAALLQGSDQIQLVARVSNLDELLAAVEEHTPDAVLTDIRMPPTNTTEGIDCFFPDPEGTPHAVLGMYEVFPISGDTGAALPEPHALITATEDGLEIPAMSAGEQVVEFRNDGSKPHELVLVAFEPGKTVEDVDKWVGSGYPGEPPVTFLGGMQTIPPGASVFITIQLQPGVDYTAADFTGRHMEAFTVS